MKLTKKQIEAIESIDGWHDFMREGIEEEIAKAKSKNDKAKVKDLKRQLKQYNENHPPNELADFVQGALNRKTNK